MKIGLIGLGRMGYGIAHRACNAGHDIVGFDFSADACAQAAILGVTIADSLEQVAQQCRAIWLMVPSGDPVDATIEELLPHLQEQDILIDGGNSNFKDTIRRAQKLALKNISYLDCGTSGGLKGQEIGYSLMIGGDVAAYSKLKPLFESIAAPNGFDHVGPAGAGHYVKMVHNGVEYGIMQAYAEGFHILKEGTFASANFDLHKITRIWNNGGIVRSFLLELTRDILKKDQELKDISGEIAESGMGLWTSQEANDNKIPATVIEESLAVRARSRETGGNYATKLVALMRNAFGGHAVKKV